ncbi:hypothetical protein MMPV_007566 [Pyropia vietnamensis]
MGGPQPRACVVPASEDRPDAIAGSGSGGSSGGSDAAVPAALLPADVAALLSRPRVSKPPDAAPVGAGGSPAAAASLTPDNLFFHRVVSVLTTITTPFQQLAVVDTGTYGRALVLDGKIQTATGDEAFYHEPLVHIPAVLFATRPSAFVADGNSSRSSNGDGSEWGLAGGLPASAPTSALVLGGGDGGSVRELLRWPSMTAVTLVDIDGAVVDACRTHLRAIHGGALDGDPRVHVVIGDAIAFVADHHDTYDLILCDVTDPLEDGPSAALFTREFFATVGRLLAPGGVMAMQAGPSSLVENPRLHPRVMRTLSSVFPHVASFVSYIPTYGSPLGFGIASFTTPTDAPPARITDTILASLTGPPLVAMDGAALIGAFGIPACLRRAIAAETVVYTTETPVDTLGASTGGNREGSDVDDDRGGAPQVTSH